MVDKHRVPPLTNRKHEEFVKGLLRGKTQAQAYIAAGYNPDSKPERTSTKAGQLWKKAHVQMRYRYLADQSARNAVTSKTRVLKELGAIAHADIRKILTWGESVAIKDADTGEYVKVPDMLALKASNEIDDATAAAISEISIDKNGNFKFKFHDKRAALHDIGTHLGMFVKRIGGPDGGDLKVDAIIRPTMTPREAADAYAQSLNATAIESVESEDDEAADDQDGDDSAAEDADESGMAS